MTDSLVFKNSTGGAEFSPPAEFTSAGLRLAGGGRMRPPLGEPSLGGFAGGLRLFLFAFQRLFASDVYFDLLRLGFGFLGQSHLQQALVVVGLNIFMVNRVGQGESAGEAAVLTLHSAIVLFFFFLLELA